MAQEAETCSKYLTSSNKRSLHHFSYTKLHCLNNTPTCFGAHRRHPQGVPFELLNLPTHVGVLVEQCNLVYWKWYIERWFDEDG